jgi:predicted glutamine amidotransferase
MCRLVGIVASEPTEFGLCLNTAERSLAALSREHPDGWGIAIHSHEWRVHKGIERAYEDRRFHEVAARSRGHMLIAHIRQKTVGPTRVENTHPFERDGWVFAHNGTLTDLPAVRDRSSSRRLGEVTGDTDSELLFAFLLSRLDAHGAHASKKDATRVLATATTELRDRKVGAFNFLLSNGEVTFVHRFGRTLFLLERGPGDPVRERRDLMGSTMLVTRWTSRRRAILVASERITNEPWQEVPEGSFFRVDREPAPRVVSGEDEEEKIAS